MQGSLELGVPPGSELLIEMELVDAVNRLPIDFFHKHDTNKDDRLTYHEVLNNLFKEVIFMSNFKQFQFNLYVIQEAFELDMMRRKGKDELVNKRERELHEYTGDIFDSYDSNMDGSLTLQEYMKEEL